jgi:hypothetical protein
MNQRSPQATRGLEWSTSCGRSGSTRDRYRCCTGRGHEGEVLEAVVTAKRDKAGAL